MSPSQPGIDQSALQGPAGASLPRTRLVVLVAVSVLLGISLFAWATHKGIGLSADSVFYHAGAHSIAAGRGYTVSGASGQAIPITSFPPGYSLVLAGFEAAGWDCRRAALPLHGVVFALNVMLVGLVVYRCAGGGQRPVSAPLMGGAAALVMAGSSQVIEAHAHLWSEPIYLPLMLGALLGSAGAVSAQRRESLRRALWLAAVAGVLTAVCYLLRYAALSLAAYCGALLAVGALAATRTGFGGRWQRWRGVLLMGCAYILPLACVMGYMAWHNAGAGSAAIGRERGWHPPGPHHWDTFGGTLEEWFVPGGAFANVIERPTRAALILGGVVLGVLVATALSPLTRRQDPAPHPLPENERTWRFIPAVLAGYALFYVLFLLVSITLYDFATNPDRRILLPTFVCLLIAGFGALGRWRLLDGAGRPSAVTAARAVVLIPLFAFVISSLAGGVRFAAFGHQSGLGYASARWQELEIWADLASLPPEVPLWSNASDVIRLMQDKPARRLPRSLDPTAADRKTPAPGLEQGLERLRRNMERDSALVVYFDHVKSSRWMYLNPKQLEAALEVEKLLARPKTTIYIHRRAARYDELKQWARERSATSK